MLADEQETRWEQGSALRGSQTLNERLQAFTKSLAGAMQSPLGQRIIAIARNELNRIERSPSLTPNQAQALSMKIMPVLSQLVEAFSEHRRPFDWLLNRDANPMRMEMTLHRLAGIIAQLDAILAEFSAMTGQNGTFQSTSIAQSNTSVAISAAQERDHLHMPSPEQCQRVAEGLKALGRQAVEAAKSIEDSISGGHATNPFDVTGAVAELYVLVSWLRDSREALHSMLWNLPPQSAR